MNITNENTKIWGKPTFSQKPLKPEIFFKQLRHLKRLGVCTNVQVKQTLAVPASNKETVNLHFKNLNTI